MMKNKCRFCADEVRFPLDICNGCLPVYEGILKNV